MSDNEGIASPPYPSQAATVSSLYHHLRVLSQWLVALQEELRAIVPPKFAAKLVAPDPLPLQTVWAGVSITDHYTVLTSVRRIRESWDHIIREHEDSWESKLARQRRYALCVYAQHILSEAFVAPEVREMRDQQAYDQYAKHMKTLDAHLKKVLLPPEMQEEIVEEPTDEEIADEEWFGEEEV